MIATAASMLAGSLVATGPAVAAGPSVTFTDPGSPPAGVVTLRGSVDPGTTNTGPGPASSTTSVLYVVDASRSTAQPELRDCDGNGVAGDTSDNLNGDGAIGDTLDCEIAAVRALDASLGSSAGTVQTGIVAFNNVAAVGDLDPSLDAAPAFLPVGFTGGDPDPRLVTVARSLKRNRLELYTNRGLDASATKVGLAVTTALDALAAAPAGPKYIFLLTDATDGDDALDTARARLQSEGVKLRAFAISDAVDACEGGSGLATLSGATGETCVQVSNPAALAASLSSSQPGSISGVSVAIGGLTLAADIDAVGGWSAAFQLGAGSYTATATARLTSGAVVSTDRTFTVQPAAGGGAGAPAPGTVAAGPGSQVATGITARRPKPLRAAVPKTVSGKVGRSSAGSLSAAPGLNGATVQLQGRARAGSVWVNLARTKVVAGAYTVSWKRTKKITSLRVQLLPTGAFAASPATVVPTAKINRCSVKRAGARRTLTCHTLVANGTKARLLDGTAVLDRARVRKGLITVVTGRSLSGDVLSIDVSKRRHVRLHL